MGDDRWSCLSPLIGFTDNRQPLKSTCDFTLTDDENNIFPTKKMIYFRRRRWVDVLRSDVDLLRSTSDLSWSTSDLARSKQKIVVGVQSSLYMRLSPSISFFFLSAIHVSFSVLMENILEFWTSSFWVLVTGSENCKILQFQIFLVLEWIMV